MEYRLDKEGKEHHHHEDFTIKHVFFRSDISDVEYRLDKEGKEYHHHEDFASMYRAEVTLIIS